MAAKEFIVGGVDANWSTAGNWNPANKPATGDTVTVNAAVSSMVINEATAVIASIDMTGAAAAFVLSGAGALNCSGNVTYKASSTTTMTHTGLTTISGNCTFTSNGMTLGSALTASTASITLTLGDALNIAALTLTIGRGTFVTGNFNITCGLFTDAAIAAAKTLTLGTSVITCTNLIFSGTAPTVTDTTHTITINSDIATAVNFAGKAWGIVNFKSNASAARAHAITFGTGASFVQFNIDQLTDRRDVSISYSGDFSVSSSSTWKSGGIGNDDPTYRMLIKSSAIGTPRTLTVSAAAQTITLTDVDVQDIVIATANTPTVTGTRVGNAGGNTNAGVSAPKTVYATTLTAARSWQNTIWSASSGGATDINLYPLPQDTAVLDNGTGNNGGYTLALYAIPRVSGIDASALTEHLHIMFDDTTFYIYGSFLFNCTPGTDFSLNPNSGPTLIFDARVKNERAETLVINTSINTNWGEMNIDIESYAGTVQLASALTIAGVSSGFSYFTITSGAFNLNGQTLTTRIFSSSNANVRELKDTAGGGKIVVNALTGTGINLATDTGLTVSNAPDIDIGDSNNTLTAALTLAFGSTAKTFGDLSFKKHAGNFPYIVTGVGNTFGAVTQETPDVTYQYNSVTWPASETVNNVASYGAVGTSSYDCYLQSSAGGSPAHLSDAAGTNTFSYCTIQDMHVLGGAIWDASDGFSHDISGNDGWTWPAAGGVIGSRFGGSNIFPTVQLFKGGNL